MGREFIWRRWIRKVSLKRWRLNKGLERVERNEELSWLREQQTEKPQSRNEFGSWKNEQEDLLAGAEWAGEGAGEKAGQTGWASQIRLKLPGSYSKRTEKELEGFILSRVFWVLDEDWGWGGGSGTGANGDRFAHRFSIPAVWPHHNWSLPLRSSSSSGLCLFLSSLPSLNLFKTIPSWWPAKVANVSLYEFSLHFWHLVPFLR